MAPATARDTRPSSSLDLDVTRLPGIGLESKKLLERLEIRTIGDLLWHLPARYDDFSKYRPLRALVANQKQTAIAVIGRMTQRRTARGQLLTEAELFEEDGTPSDVRASWVGRSFGKETHREGERVRLSGDVKWVGRSLQFSQPALERADAEAVHTGRLVPIYRLTGGLKAGQVRRWLHTAIEGGPRRTAIVDEVPDLLPAQVRERHRLPDIASALRQVHFPDDTARLLAARRRLAFDELLVLQLALAQRRARSLAALFGNEGPTHALLTSSVTGEPRRRILAGLADGSIDVVVGTHALVEEAVAFDRLGLAVVDEQHRFGVRQRSTFREKGDGLDPHLLLTTATPIPQTLNQTIYRDLDISVIDELPAGRLPIITHLRTPDQLAKVWEGVRLAVERGQQAFVVTPRIDPDDTGGEELPSAIATERDLGRGELRGLRLALMHGRMAAKERDDVMRRFAAREIDVLVATTVIEVGIDIPNATVMVILGADRFGLAQLHQLRGRVGRGADRAYCVLVSDASESARLAAMVEQKEGRPLNGFELAMRDLEIRGAGEFLGPRQSGAPELRIVDLADVDPRLIDETAHEADRTLADDPSLERPDHELLAGAVDQLWRRYALA